MQYNIENKTLICIGDVHGEFSRLRFKLAQYIKKYGLTDTIFIVCGDCGFFGKNTDNKWFYHERSKINNILVNSGNELYFFRGNHDNPEFFNTNTEYIVGKSTTIKVLKDYDTLNSELYGRILIVPGAISIDRYRRTLDISYWSDEGTVKLNDDEITPIGKVDIVLSHCLPYYTKITSYMMSQLEQMEDNNKFRSDFTGEKLGYTNKLSVDLQIERDYLIHLQEVVKADKWISGHYHISNINILDNTKYVSLDIMEFYEPSYN